MKPEIFKKIISKKEFSHLPRDDVEIAWKHFEKRQVSEEEKIRLTRELLHKVYSSFVSQKILSLKNKPEDWILRKHLSTRERLSYFEKIYLKIFSFLKKDIDKISVIDLGAGINGFSYKIMEKVLRASNSERDIRKSKINYFAVESVGQLVELMNNYFAKEKISGKAYCLSLFDLEKIKKLIKKIKERKIIFMFKIIGPLELMQRDFSKKLISEIFSVLNEKDFVVLSFATKTMHKRLRFKFKRNWIINFLKDNFEILEDFEIGGERYFVVKKRIRNI